MQASRANRWDTVEQAKRAGSVRDRNDESWPASLALFPAGRRSQFGLFSVNPPIG